jgi:hypothetical protein
MTQGSRNEQDFAGGLASFNGCMSVGGTFERVGRANDGGQALGLRLG